MPRSISKPSFGHPALLSIPCLLGFGSASSAHVKWFCAFDVAGQPVGLENVLCPDFEELTALTIFVLVAADFERTPLGIALGCEPNQAIAFAI